MTPEETELKLPASVGGSPVECGSAGASHRDGGIGSSSPGGPLGRNPLKNSSLTLLQSPGPGLRPNNYQGGSATPPISRQLD